MPGPAKNFQRASKLLRQPEGARIGVPAFSPGKPIFLRPEPKGAKFTTTPRPNPPRQDNQRLGAVALQKQHVGIP
jgi:hypothetical protein